MHWHPYYTFTDAGGTPPEPPTQIPTPEVAGVKRRFRVRRQDFSTQEAYELALRAALADSQFANYERVIDEVQSKQKPKPQPQKALPLDKSLSNDLDREIKTSEADFARLQRAAEMEERELILMFIKVIEDSL